MGVTLIALPCWVAWESFNILTAWLVLPHAPARLLSDAVPATQGGFVTRDSAVLEIGSLSAGVQAAQN